MWVSEGVDDGNAKAFADGLAKLGTLGIFEDEADKAPIAMRPPDNANTGFGVTLARLPADNQRGGRVAAVGGRGLILETAPLHFGLLATDTQANISLPPRLRDDTLRIAKMPNDSSDALQLIDTR